MDMFEKWNGFETVKEIVDKYEVDSNIVAQDVEKMVDKLYKVGVLEK